MHDEGLTTEDSSRLGAAIAHKLQSIMVEEDTATTPVLAFEKEHVRKKVALGEP